MVSDGTWEKCLNKDSTECDSSDVCLWSNGADMIPDKDFCAPLFMSSNVTYIKECMNAEKDVCTGQCLWSKGKVVDSNNELVANADLFGANFCHPPSTNNWEEQLPGCIDFKNLDSCNAGRKCVWSTGKEF